MVFRIVLILQLLCLVFSSAAQDTIALSRLQERTPLWKAGRVTWAQDTAALSDKGGESLWQPVDSLTSVKRDGYFWIQFVFQNDTPVDAMIDLDFTAADSITVIGTNSDTSFTIQSGPYMAVQKWAYFEDSGIIPVRVGAGEYFHFNVKLWSAKGRPKSVKNCYIQTRESTLRDTVVGYRSFIGRVEFNGFFLGAVTFSMLFFVFIYLKVRERVFLLYALYLLGAGFYSLIVKTLPYSFLARLAYLDYPATYALGEPVQYLFFASYIGFGRELMDIDERYGVLRRVLNFSIAVLVLSGVGLGGYNLYHLDFQLQQLAFIYSRLVILPVAILLLVWIIFKVKNPVKWFFVTGSSFFVLGGLLAVMVDPKSRHLFFGESLIANPIVIFKTGILLESLCFALALGYKFRIAQREKDKASKAYIDQLELNRKMAASETERLEKMVLERTEEVLEKTRQIEEQKQMQIRSDFERQLAGLEMKALRSQMNPHFIFNSLNSIRYQILKEDYDNAANYLTRFSKLLRYILQNSREHVISLAEELQMNRLYLELESLRFSQGFEFYFDIDEEIDLSDIIVPPMLLQPYVENGVKHGLIPSEKSVKRIVITVEGCNDGYRIMIEDNGIGRQAAEGQPKLKDAQSLGLKIANERIKLFNQQYRPFITVSITDLYDDEQLPMGTRITFIYKN